MQCKVCEKKFGEGQIVFVCLETGVYCCTKECCNKYDDKLRPQGIVINTWEENTYTIRKFDSCGCRIVKTVLQMKDSTPVVQVNINMPGGVSPDSLMKFAGESVTVVITKSELIPVPKKKEKK